MIRVIKEAVLMWMEKKQDRIKIISNVFIYLDKDEN